LISNHFRDSVGGPEKAGVGGSIPSLATILFNNLAIAKNIENKSREQYANIAHRRSSCRRLVHVSSTCLALCCWLTVFPTMGAVSEAEAAMLETTRNNQPGTHRADERGSGEQYVAPARAAVH